VYEAIDSDQADIGLVSYPKSSRMLKSIPWRDEPMVLVCSPQHRFAGMEQIGLEELAGEKMIGFDQGLTIRREIDRVLSQHNVEAQVIMEFDNIETIKRAIEINAGVGLLPAPTVVREVEVGTLAAIPLENNELVRPLAIIHRSGKKLSMTVRRFIELLQRAGRDVPQAIHNGAPACAPNGEAIATPAQPVPAS
jgi:DNA-binding transcriptional LysR family regulator